MEEAMNTQPQLIEFRGVGGDGQTEPCGDTRSQSAVYTGETTAARNPGTLALGSLTPRHQFPACPGGGAVAAHGAGSESMLGIRPRNYGDVPRRAVKEQESVIASAEMPTSPTSSEMETRLDYAVGGFFLGCCVMVGAYILGILAWRSM